MNNFKILKELIKRFQGVRAVLYFAEIIGMGVADGISVVLVSRIIGIITDTAVSKGNLRDTPLVKYIILTIIFKIIIQTLLAVLYNDEAKRTGANMRNTVYGKALSLPMEFYDNHHTGEFMSKLTYDTNMASGVFGSRIRRVMMPVIMVIVCIIPMFVLCPPVTAGLLVLCIISLTLNFVMIPVLEKYSRKISDANKEISKSVTNMLQGMETIRMFPLKKVISDSYNNANEKCGKNMKIQGRTEALISALRAAFDLIGALVFLALGILYTTKTGGKLGNLISLYSIYGAFQYNFLLMGVYIPSLSSWLVNAQRVLEFLDTPNENFYGEGKENAKDNIMIKDNYVYLCSPYMPGQKGLRIMRTGLLLGELKKNRFEPSQALAMVLKMSDYPDVINLPASDERVIKYLKGETLDLPEFDGKTGDGWNLFCVDGYPLGWGKFKNGSLKNKYLAGWRWQ